MLKINGRELANAQLAGSDLDSIKFNGNIVWKRTPCECPRCKGKNTVFKKWIVKPGCIAEGLSEHVCKDNLPVHMRNPFKFQVIQPPIGHKYKGEVTVEPTCLLDGIETFTCIRCGDAYREVIPALGHHYIAMTEKYPTCTEPGILRYSCTRCDSTYTQPIPALGHDYVEYLIKKPTMDRDGLAKFICTRCGDTYTKVIPSLRNNLRWRLSADEKTLYLSSTGSTSEGYTIYEGGLILGDGRRHEKVTRVVAEDANLKLPIYCNGMFQNFKSLTSIDVSKFNVFNVRSMVGMFEGCISLKTINMSNWDPWHVEDMREMFARCESLTTASMALATSNPVNARAMFSECSNLTSLDLTAFDTSNVWCSEFMFYNCVELKHIYAGGMWNLEKCVSSKDMFENCTKLHNWNRSYLDKTKAVIDDGFNGGYLERK